MIRILLCAAALALPQASAAARPEACLTSVEASKLVLFMAPSAIEAAAGKCAATLPEGAVLRGGYRDFAERLRAQVSQDWPAIRTVLGKVGRGRIPEGLKDETLRSFMDDIFVAKIGKDLKATDCAVVDSALSALSPLPPRNVGDLVAAVVELGTRDDKDRGRLLMICRNR